MDMTSEEKNVLDIARKEENIPVTIAKEDGIRQLAERYKAQGEKVYLVTSTVTEDDETETEFPFLFKRPGVASYDRYVKTMSNSVTKASKAFANDNIVVEQREELREALEEYPAMAINIATKLLAMLGLTDFTTVKKQ